MGGTVKKINSGINSTENTRENTKKSIMALQRFLKFVLKYMSLEENSKLLD